jgi:hypothetical protein
LKQLEMQMQGPIEQAKLQAQAQSEKMKAEVARDREMAQMQADLATKQQEAEIQAQTDARAMQLEIDKFNAELAFKREELASKRQIELMKLGASENDGNVTKDSDTRENMLSEVMTKMMETFAKANGAKKVIRDENGDVIGVEPVQ